MSEVEYNALLFDISGKLDELNELPKLIFMCRGKIAEDKEAGIQNVLMLFKELERKRNLGIDNFEVLKTVLEQMKRKGKTLLKKVEDFEKKRKVMSVGIIPSLKQAARKIVGAVKMICNFRTVAGGLVVVGSGMVLRSCSSPEEFTEAFNKVVLVAATKLIEISGGSVCFTIQAQNLSALEALWDSYQNGTLRQRLQEFLVTEEIKSLYDGQEIEVIVNIEEQEYIEACFDLMVLETEASDIDQEGQLYKTCRRNSDSTLYLKPMEVEVMSVSLKQAENKLNFERQRRQNLEKENEILSSKLMKAISTVTTGASMVQSFEDLTLLEKGAASLRRRRNSDSILYFRSMNAEEPLWQLRKDELHVPEGELKEKDNYEPQAEDMEPERLAYVQRYLEKLQETHSVTSETTVSSLGANSGPSGTEEDSSFLFGGFGISDEPRFRDLSGKVIKELSRRLENDEEAWRNVCEGLQLTDLGREPVTLEKVISFFPETPVKLLKDVFDALQLYDFVELLEKVKVNHSSLQLQRTLQEVKTLRTSDKRPTTYHSNVAVMIIYVPTERRAKNTKRISKFFMDLNSDNDVTNISGLRRMRRERMKKELRELSRLRELEELGELKLWSEEKLSELMELTHMTLKQIWTLSDEKLRSLRMERERKVEETEMTERVALETMDRWLQNQDNFTFCAVFDFAGVLGEYTFMIEKLETLADKAKLIFTKGDHLTTFGNLPETLLVSLPHYLPKWKRLTGAFLKIFNKRWQTLDLCSIMEEMRRAVGSEMQIRDNMSRSVRFKKLEDKDSA